MNLDFLDLSGKVGVFDQLREANGGEELTGEMKDKFLEMVDIEKNEEGYYVDAFNNPISFNGIPGLVKGKTRIKLTPIHKNELIVCSKDFKYFRRNYCKIVSKLGIDRPDPRPYQEKAEDDMLTGKDCLLFWPRQCVSSNTIIETMDGHIEIKELLNGDKKELKVKDSLFTNTYKVNNCVKTPFGFRNISEVHISKKLPKYKIKLENGNILEGAENHVVIDKNYNEIHLKNSLGKYLITTHGTSKVVECIDTQQEDIFYDITIDSIDNLYYTNNILSHNSGKSVSTGIYILWRSLFKENINVGIAANVQKLAVEVLDKVKKIYVYLPIWLQPGLVSWNKQSIELSNGVKILTSATSGDSFRGFSINLLYCSHEDETITIKKDEEIKEVNFKEAQEMYSLDSTIKILTSDGFKRFKGFKTSKHSEYLEFKFDDSNKFKCSKSHQFKYKDGYIRADKLSVGDIISNKKIVNINVKNSLETDIFYDPIGVVDTSTYISSGLDSHNCDEVGFLASSRLWEEFSDAVFPSQEALADKQVILSSTAKGFNFWYALVSGAKKNKEIKVKSNDKIELEDGSFISVEEYYRSLNNES